jgi:hypothetical protein
MKIITRAVLDMNTMQWLPELEESFEYAGVVALCKDDTNQENAASSLKDMTKQLQQSFGTNFASQQAIMKNIDDSIKATIAAGPSQYGFSAQEDAALRTQSDEGTAANYRSARQATGEALAALGGGNTFLPSGTAAVLKAQNANAAAAQQSNQNLGITKAGWDTGRQNYANALNIGETSAKVLDPSQYSGQALSGANSTFDAYKTIASEPTTGGVIGGILGSVAGAAVGGLTGGGGLLAQKVKS